MPSTLIITAELDVLRDEGEAYARKLSQAGVAVTAVRHLGTVHSFMVIGALASSSSTHAAIGLASLHLRRAFATH